MNQLIFARYQELQAYVGWGPEDVRRVQDAAPLLLPHVPALVEDFYAEVLRHELTRQVLRGGLPQVQALKGTLAQWLRELLGGVYDRDYVERRWRVGLRHVEIGLEQAFANAALSRLRGHLMRLLLSAPELEPAEARQAVISLNRLIDLDQALIEDAYQTEFRVRQQRVQRLITIGHVAGGLAHELRNPLNVIKTSVYFLLHAQGLSLAKTREHLERIDRQTEMANDVITALSDFAKLPQPERKPVPVAALLEDVLVAAELPPEIRVERVWPQGLPPLSGDERQLRMVFGNLIRNAAEAMPQGGVVTLSAAPAGRNVCVFVRDTGGGIARENLQRIMEPLYSTKARGIGLGLSIARAIVENHGGAIQAASEPGQGAEFVVRLPAEPPPQFQGVDV